MTSEPFVKITKAYSLRLLPHSLAAQTSPTIRAEMTGHLFFSDDIGRSLMGCTMSGAFVFIMTSYGTTLSELCAFKGGASRHTLRLILHRNNVQVSRNNV